MVPIFSLPENAVTEAAMAAAQPTAAARSIAAEVMGVEVDPRAPEGRMVCRVPKD
jgi:hypothetical protein